MRKLVLVIVTSLLCANLFAAVRQEVLDDGFTWFEAVNGEALGPDNIPVSPGWYLKANLRVPSNSPNAVKSWWEN